MNPLRTLRELGQSVWLDDIHRRWLDDGLLQRLIEEDGLAGVTSNPAIFEKAVREGGEYDAEIAALAREGLAAGEIYERLILEDVRRAADLLRPVYEATEGRDGYVSLEVSPHLADDTEATIKEGRRLWAAFDRPNAMIKVPATGAGLPAISTLLAEGVNVNVTLLFGILRYDDVVEAFLAGLEARAAQGAPLDRLASVASFFLSRIDTRVDKHLDELGTPEARALRGRAAIASARLAYQHHREWTTSERWQRLAGQGAHTQRLLWASTSSKDPAYADTKYVEAIIAPDTVTTLPYPTLQAYRDHGRPAVRIEDDLEGARDLPYSLQELGIDLDAVSALLEREGLQKFVEPFDALQETIDLRGDELASS